MRLKARKLSLIEDRGQTNSVRVRIRFKVRVAVRVRARVKLRAGLELET